MMVSRTCPSFSPISIDSQPQSLAGHGAPDGRAGTLYMYIVHAGRDVCVSSFLVRRLTNLVRRSLISSWIESTDENQSGNS